MKITEKNTFFLSSIIELQFPIKIKELICFKKCIYTSTVFYYTALFKWCTAALSLVFQ